MAGLRRSKTKKEKPISPANAQTNLYVDDEREVQRIVSASGVTRADAIRDLVAAGVRAKRLRAVGKDEAMRDVVDAQKSVVSEGNAPLIAALYEQKSFVEGSVRQMQLEYASIEERLARIENALMFLIKGFDRILQNIVIIRAVIWHYVFEFYYTVMVSADKRLKREHLQKNYEDRLKDIKIEATRERSLCGEVALEKAVSVVGTNLRRDGNNPPSVPPSHHPSTTPPSTG